MRRICLLTALQIAAPALATGAWRASSPSERVLDAASFQGVEQAITQHMEDVQSVVVLLQGRVVYEYYRDKNPDTLRDQQSVAKSALSTLVGIALGQGRIASLDQPVVALVPEWASLNRDPRAAAITVRHLLTMTAGFEVNDPRGTAASSPRRYAWSRTLAAAPGEKFAYDNSIVPLLSAVLEKATGMPLADYARLHLVGPLAFAEPSYQRGLYLRTVDMAKLGQLFLQQGAWGGKQILPEAFVTAAVQPQNAGGLPGAMPYGYMWWILPSNGPVKTFMASGYAGQVIWVQQPMGLVIAVTSTVSPEGQRRGQCLQLIRAKLIPAAQERLAKQPR
jgi:CubicO group peptidase (beta-lactamase class C family)